MKKLMVIGTCLLLTPFMSASRADTLTVPCIADTALEGFDFSQVYNAGKAESNNVGQTGLGGNASMRGLMKFDLSDIPGGATITGVKVNVFVVFTPPGGATATFELHRVLQEWFEGNKGAGSLSGEPADTGETTWAQRITGVADWGAPGATSSDDINLVASSTVSIGAPSHYTFPSTLALVADVQAWMNNPASNFGWLMNAPVTPIQSAKRFGTRESSPATQPTLEVTFTAPAAELKITSFTPSASGVTLTWTGGAGPYRVQRADSINGPWTFVTPASSATTANAPLGGTIGFYRVVSLAL